MTFRTLEPFDPDAVAPWQLGTGRRGVLLLHGFAGTPPELRHLGAHLAANGWRCVAPALAGHAATPEELEATTWRDWASSAQRALDELAGESSEVMVAGQSMGGAMALHLAANDLRIRAVASLATPLWLSGVLHHFLPVIVHGVRWHYPGGDVDLWNPDAVNELYSYGRRPTRSIRELKRLLRTVRNELAQVRAPVLIVHGARDRTADPRSAGELEERLVCSARVEKHILPRSGHAISVDVDRDAVNAEVLAWFDRYSIFREPATADLAGAAG